MALEYEVAPNTIQRALMSLEQEHLIYTERTNGKYVTQNRDMLSAVREETLKRCISDMLNGLRLHGFSDDEIKTGIERELN